MKQNKFNIVENRMLNYYSMINNFGRLLFIIHYKLKYSYKLILLKTKTMLLHNKKVLKKYGNLKKNITVADKSGSSLLIS